MGYRRATHPILIRCSGCRGAESRETERRKKKAKGNRNGASEPTANLSGVGVERRQCQGGVARKSGRREANQKTVGGGSGQRYEL